MTARTTRSPEVELPDDAELARLKLSPEVAWYLLSRGFGLPELMVLAIIFFFFIMPLLSRRRRGGCARPVRAGRASGRATA